MAGLSQKKNPFMEQVRQRVENHQQISVLMHPERINTNRTNLPGMDLPLVSAVVQPRLQGLPFGRTFSLQGTIPTIGQTRRHLLPKAPPPIIGNTPIEKLPSPLTAHQRQTQSTEISLQTEESPSDAVNRPQTPQAVGRKTNAPASTQPVDERNWRRLETILNKHQEQQQTETPKEILEELYRENLRDDRPSDDTFPLEHDTMAEEPVYPDTNPARVEKPDFPVDEAQTKHSAASSPEPVGSFPAATAIPVPHGVLQKTPALQHSDSSVVQGISVPSNPAVENSRLEETVVPTAHAPQEPQPLQQQQSLSGVKNKENIQVDETGSYPAPAQSSLPYEQPPQSAEAPSLKNRREGFPSSDEIAEEEDQTSTLPLDQAWQVQVRNDKPVETAKNTSRISASTPLPPLAETTEMTYQQEALQQVLQNVPAAQPSAADIEIIPPRHKRPSVPYQAQPTTRARKPGDQEDANRPPTLSPTAEESLTKKRTEPDSANPPAVETEIGPLPVDLWSLLDEPVPSPGQTAQLQTVDAETSPPQADHSPDEIPHLANTMGEEPAPMMAAKPATAQPKFAAEQVPLFHPSTQTEGTVLQRQPEASEPEIGEGEEKKDKDEKGVDIEQLSHKVFQEIKRRLSREQDRHRYSS